MSRQGFRILAGVVLILLILFCQDLYGTATAASRLDPALRATDGPATVIVVLDFTPERFHSERLGQYGVFAGRDGAVNRIRLRNVTPGNLGRLSRLVWVSRIEPAPKPGVKPS